MLTFEFAILNFIYGHFHSAMMDKLMLVITRLGNEGIIWIVLTIALLLSSNYRRAGAATLFALALEVIVCNIVLKPLIARIRPCDVNTAVQLLIIRPTDYSFPSGHAASSFAAASALYFSRRKLWKPALVLAALIAFSRLYLYLHYPTDVLAGAIIGIIMGYLGFSIAVFLKNLWRHRRREGKMR